MVEVKRRTWGASMRIAAAASAALLVVGAGFAAGRITRGDTSSDADLEQIDISSRTVRLRGLSEAQPLPPLRQISKPRSETPSSSSSPSPPPSPSLPPSPPPPSATPPPSPPAPEEPIVIVEE